MITIRRCLAADVPDVLAFLDAQWKPGHIFTVSRPLFDWQYASPDRPGEYSIVIARRDSDNALLGMLGYLPTRRFDPALADDNALWLALWKVHDDAPGGGLGLRLLANLTENEPHVSIGVIGFQPPVAAIYTALKYRVGELQHYVLPNPHVSSFELAEFDRVPTMPIVDRGFVAEPLTVETFDTAVARLDSGDRHEQVPRKTPDYFRSRYLLHPVYRYSCFVVRRRDARVALVATRVARHAGRCALRIVDVFGPDDVIAGLGALMLPEVSRLGAEYADVHNWGIDPALFEDGGFTAVNPEAGDVVPNHFEPFERRNAPIRFALKTNRPAVLFKGDGDQDRPNRLEPDR